MQKYLGPPKYRYGTAEERDEIGVTTRPLEIIPVEHMDQVLREALRLENPESFFKPPAALGPANEPMLLPEASGTG